MLIRFFSFGLWVSAACIFCFVWGFLIEPTRLVVRHHTIDAPTWNGEPLRIIFVADFHMGGIHVPPEAVANVVGRINDLNPDIVLIGGDFADGVGKRKTRSERFLTRLDAGMSELSKLDSKLGVYASLGNHDAVHGNGHIKRGLEKAGVIVKNNGVEQFENGLCVVGLADAWFGRPDPDLLEECSPNTTIVAFMHSPDTFAKLPHKKISLALAGHTHAGQINLPVLGRLVTATKLPNKYAYGLNIYNDFPVYVTAGIGMSGIPARFRAPPEIAVITLK